MTTTATNLTAKELAAIYGYAAPLAGPDFLEFPISSISELLDAACDHWESHFKCGPCLRVLRDLVNGKRFTLRKWDNGEVVGEATVLETIEGLMGFSLHHQDTKGCRVGVVGVGTCYVDFS